MVEDLNLPVEIRVCPIVREPDGLALSSRNVYLSPAGRQQATVLWKSLQLAEELVRRGERNSRPDPAGDARCAGDGHMPAWIISPWSIRQTLAPLDRIAARTLAVLAVWIEDTRLIDNCILEAEDG